MTINPKTLTVEEINEASAKILSDPLLRRFYSWSIDMSRTFFAPPAQPELVECPKPWKCNRCGASLAEGENHLKALYHPGHFAYTCQPAQPEMEFQLLSADEIIPYLKARETPEPAAPVEMPVVLAAAIGAITDAYDETDEGHQCAVDLREWWRDHTQPVGITPALERLIDFCTESAMRRNVPCGSQVFIDIVTVREQYGRKG